MSFQDDVAKILREIQINNCEIQRLAYLTCLSSRPHDSETILRCLEIKHTAIKKCYLYDIFNNNKVVDDIKQQS